MALSRSDETRRRIIDAAVEVFAEKGFAKASTREIARRAKANIASINYHYGDKAGLYRAVFMDHSETQSNYDRAINETTTFEDLFRDFISIFLSNILGTKFPRLIAREHIEPTGLLGEEWHAQGHRRHLLMENAICRKLSVSQPDPDIARLTYAIAGIVLMFDHARPMIEKFDPDLIKGDGWVESLIEPMTAYAVAMIEAERVRRSAGTLHVQHAPTIISPND